jgi:hypothetical protein
VDLVLLSVRLKVNPATSLPALPVAFAVYVVGDRLVQPKSKYWPVAAHGIPA